MNDRPLLGAKPDECNVDDQHSVPSAQTPVTCRYTWITLLNEQVHLHWQRNYGRYSFSPLPPLRSIPYLIPPPPI